MKAPIKPKYRFGKTIAIIALIIIFPLLTLNYFYFRQAPIILIISIFTIAIIFRGFSTIKRDFTISGNFLTFYFPKKKYDLTKDLDDYSCNFQTYSLPKGAGTVTYSIFRLNFKDGKTYEISSKNMVNYLEIQKGILDIVGHYQ